MNHFVYEKRKKVVEQIATLYLWEPESEDKNSFKISYVNETGIFRVDFWLTKMTVGIFKIGESIKYIKHQDLSSIEDLLINPEKYYERTN